MTNAQKYAQWMDDQLDLYNYAVRIGDIDWQRELLLQLQDKDSFREQLRRDEARTKLWQEFEEINRQMEGIYSRLREAESDAVRSHLWEAAWKLRKERSRIAALLRESGEGSGWRREKGSLRG